MPKGFGIDYDEVFSPVASYIILGFLLSFAVQHEMKLLALDVVAAFLNGNVNENLYMEQPQGFRI